MTVLIRVVGRAAGVVDYGVSFGYPKHISVAGSRHRVQCVASRGSLVRRVFEDVREFSIGDHFGAT